ncbi:MAG: NfeD family protein [Candidatus Zixiibacteriota bacterium]
MRFNHIIWTLFFISLILFSTAAYSGTIDVLSVDGAINPVSSQYIIEGIEKAEENGRSAVIIRLDTPGGLMTSMDDINKRILNSEIPVLVYIWPSGARAASAGTFITYASHCAAMTPGTRIGAAHPVSMGIGAGGGGDEENKPDTVMTAKMTNDAVAQIVSYANMRGRNAEWVKKAVRESASIDEAIAESLGVIEFIAEDLEEFIQKAQGCSITVANRKMILDIEDDDVNHIPMGQLAKFLYTITDPNIAYLLLLAGMLGLFFELRNPGGIVPGVVGGISLLLAFYAFQMLPINYVGVMLIILGVVLFIIETQVPGIGILAIGGVVSLLMGSFLLTEGAPDFLSIKWQVVLPTVAFFALFFLFLVYKFAEAKLKQSVTGEEGMAGLEAEVRTPKDENGKCKVFVHSEIWDAYTKDDVEVGDTVIVKEVDGLKLHVEKKPENVIE